ncbi:MAG TPA: GNVR domain-containing protein [Bryobacteraceae bacterium]|jgi:uncharacterized protein involved in exopolysaccharide biosynthesis|nr:GNVR domain-containing protein [Bryobacteraceae bacterium]
MAKSVEGDAQLVWQREKSHADALNNRTIEYTMAKQEADQSRTLYEGLLGKLQEAGVLAGLRSSNISLVDPARAPARPTKPNVLLVLAGSLAGGLFLGSCLALASDSSDNKIQDLLKLQQTLGDFLLGVLPYHPQKSALC